MKMLITLTAIVVMTLGIGLSAWGPLAFEFLSGHEVPAPDGTDPVAMTIWSGVAFLRVFGAVFFGLGAVLLAIAMRRESLTVERAIVGSSLFAGAVTAVQAQAIWDGWWGFVLAALLGAVGLVAGAYGLGNHTQEPATNGA